MRWFGIVADGFGRCAEADQWPHGWEPGSLNLTPIDGPLLGRTLHCPPPEWDRDDYWGEPTICPGTVEGVDVIVFNEFPTVVELVARVRLRTVLDVANGDVVEVEIPSEYTA